MQNFMLTPIDPEKLINSISEKITANILQAVRGEQAPIKQTEQFLTIQEAATLFNLKVPTMYSKVSRGEIPVMKRGKRLYFSRSELLEYLKEGRKKSNSEIEMEAESYLANKKSTGL